MTLEYTCRIVMIPDCPRKTDWLMPISSFSTSADVKHPTQSLYATWLVNQTDSVFCRNSLLKDETADKVSYRSKTLACNFFHFL